MVAMTNFLEKRLLDHTLGKTAYAMPTVHLALFTANPGEAGSLAAEVPTGRGYARRPLTAAMAAADTTAGTSSNTAALTFGPATADWGEITHIGVMDAATGGNMLLYGALAIPKVINSGDSLQIAAGQLTITFD